MRLREAAPLGLVLLMFVLAYSVRDRVPDRMVVHWNARGEADGFGGKFTGLYLMPLMTLLLLGLFYVIPKIEVLEFRKNILDFDKHYFGLRTVFVGFMAGIHAVSVLINLGYDIDMTYFIVPAMAALFYYMGYIMQYIKRNFWIGFRTPWTITNEVVWNKTHKAGSRIFRWGAILMLAGLIKPEYGVWTILLVALGATAYILAYSYTLYRRETSAK